MRYGEDYRNANVPMLGAIAGAKVVSVQVVLYAWAMVACSLLMIPAGGAGWVYTVTAVAPVPGSSTNRTPCTTARRPATFPTRER